MCLDQASPFRKLFACGFGTVKIWSSMAFGCAFNPCSSVGSSFLIQMYWSNLCSDCFLDCSRRNIWGDRIIKLLDTMFWPQLTSKPDKYKDNFKKKKQFNCMRFCCDPDDRIVSSFLLDELWINQFIFRNHWRLGILENPTGLLEGKT